MDDKYKSMAKVVSKIDDYKFVINRGVEHGVKLGANYLVFGLGDHLRDPDTGEDLGVLEIVRGRAKVTHVQEKLATLESTEVVITPGTTRKVKRSSRSMFAMLDVPTEEEIEEGAQRHIAEIEVHPGDIAK